MLTCRLRNNTKQQGSDFSVNKWHPIEIIVIQVYRF